MPNVMAALPNIGGALCSTPQSLADAHCRAVTLPRRETCWNLQGCLKLVNRSQPLVGRSSSYCKDMWGRHCCLKAFFQIVDVCLSCEDIARQSCVMVPRWRFLATFCILYFQRAARSTFQTCILNLHYRATPDAIAQYIMFWEATTQSRCQTAAVKLAAYQFY